MSGFLFLPCMLLARSLLRAAAAISFIRDILSIDPCQKSILMS